MELWGEEAAAALAGGLGVLQRSCSNPGRQAVRLAGSGVLADLVALQCRNLEAVKFSAGGGMVRHCRKRGWVGVGVGVWEACGWWVHLGKARGCRARA